MSLSSFALILAIGLSALYVILAFVAFSHVNKEKTTRLIPGLLALTFWWPFYDIYDQSGRRLCFYGRILLTIAIAAYLLWMFNLNKS